MPIKRDGGGRFAPGTKCGGRPKGMLDFRAVVKAKAAESGMRLEDAVWSVFEAMLSKASGGDVRAAALVLERLCGPVAIEFAEDDSLAERIKAARLRVITRADGQREGATDA